MNSPIKNGKKALSTKQNPVKVFTTDDVFGNNLSLPPEVAEDFKKKGWVPRWIDAQQLHGRGGYHPKGWVVYRRSFDQSATIKSDDMKWGNDPDGVVRRGSLILAYKTKEKADEHRGFLKQRANLHSQNQKSQADELRAMAREGGLETKIHEGYEENE